MCSSRGPLGPTLLWFIRISIGSTTALQHRLCCVGWRSERATGIVVHTVVLTTQGWVARRSRTPGERFTSFYISDGHPGSALVVWWSADTQTTPRLPTMLSWQGSRGHSRCSDLQGAVPACLPAHRHAAGLHGRACQVLRPTASWRHRASLHTRTQSDTDCLNATATLVLLALPVLLNLTPERGLRPAYRFDALPPPSYPTSTHTDEMHGPLRPGRAPRGHDALVGLFERSAKHEWCGPKILVLSPETLIERGMRCVRSDVDEPPPWPGLQPTCMRRAPSPTHPARGMCWARKSRCFLCPVNVCPREVIVIVIMSAAWHWSCHAPCSRAPHPHLRHSPHQWHTRGGHPIA